MTDPTCDMTNQEKSFEKSLPGYSSAQVQAIFEHSYEVWSVLTEASISCKVARPLRQSGTVLDYEFLNLPVDMSMLLQRPIPPEAALQKAGEVLGTLHCSHTGPTLLHSDFVPHNLFYDGSILFVIDAHPPELLGYRGDILYGDAARDVLCFSFSIPRAIGIKKCLRQRKYLTRCYQAVARGYASSNAWRMPTIKTYLIFLKDVFIMSIRAKFGLFPAALHVFGAVFFHISFFVIARREKMERNIKNR